MMIATARVSMSVSKLHQYLLVKHWRDHALIGPDPGIRFNYRIGRFVKSYFPNLPWNDDLYYLQGQGYWVLSNWLLFERTGEVKYRDIALHCSESVLRQQRNDGAWEYPNPEWKGRVATAEGIWGAFGLLETYRRTSDPTFLTGALNWHKFLIERIGFQSIGNELAINYFADREGDRVCNNSACVLRFLAELTDITGDRTYLSPCAGMLLFLQNAQKESGEFPYSVGGISGGAGQPHFQCYQYNAFQCLDLIRYRELTGDGLSLLLITKLLRFLREGLAEDGYACYECSNRHRTVIYHTAVLGAALLKGSKLAPDGYEDTADCAYSYVLRSQFPDGSFPYSKRDYNLFSDNRSYPRYLAMILYHLLHIPPEPENKLSSEHKRISQEVYFD